MSQEEVCCGLKVGQGVPDFEMDTYDPKEMFFGKISLEQLKKEGKWMNLFLFLQPPSYLSPEFLIHNRFNF